MTAGMPDWLWHRAGATPDAEALVADGRRLTYRELDGLAAAFAGALVELGIVGGDRIALIANNSLEFAVAVHGVARAGATLVPVNTRLVPSEIAGQLARVRPAVVVADGANFERSREATTAAGIANPLELPLSGRPIADPVVLHHAADPLCIIHTSGTTGAARGAVLTYGNFWASAAGSAYNLGVMPGDRWLACMPLFHVGGLSILLRSAIYGTSALIHPGFDEERVAASLHDDRVTLLSVVATMLQRILDCDDRPAPAHLRAVLVGGGPVPPALLERALDRGYPVVQTYGLTEATSQVTTLAPGDARRHLGFAGKPLVTTRLRVDASPGEPGEILVAGPIVMAGYFEDREATGKAIRDGWLHTGDIGLLDEDGFLQVLDRRDDLIVSGGENVYPAEVEAALLAHPAVTAAAVVGVTDPAWGQAVYAAVVGNPLPEAEMREWLRAHLAGYKVPRRVVSVESLPTTASGKIQRHLVRAMVEEILRRAER